MPFFWNTPHTPKFYGFTLPTQPTQKFDLRYPRTHATHVTTLFSRLFSLILVVKAKVFVICVVQIKLSIVLFEGVITKWDKCCQKEHFLLLQGREIFTGKCRVGLTGWGKFEKDEKVLMKTFGLNFFLFCFSITPFPMFVNLPKSCVSTLQWVFFGRILVLLRVSFFSF